MKINISLNDDEVEEVKNFIDELLKKKKLVAGDFIESGYFGVKISDVFDDFVLFDVYRIVNTVEVKKKDGNYRR